MNIALQYNEFLIEQDKFKRLLNLNRHVGLIQQYATEGEIGFYEAVINSYTLIRDEYKHKYNVHWFQDFSNHSRFKYDIKTVWEILQRIHDEH